MFEDITWTTDATSPVGYTAAANYKCDVTGCTETDSVDATVTPAALPAPTCVEQTVTLTAVVAAGDSLDNKAHSDTKNIPVPSNNAHTWEFVNFTWTEDADSPVGYTVKANYHCTAAGCTATSSVAASITPAALPEATCVAQTVTLLAAVTEEAGLDGVQRTDTKDVSVFSADAHDFGGWTQTSPPSCTGKGEERRDCSRCDAFETRDVDPLGHDWSAWVEVVPATETEKGLEKRTCSRCDAAEEREIPAKNNSKINCNFLEKLISFFKKLGNMLTLLFTGNCG